MIFPKLVKVVFGWQTPGTLPDSLYPSRSETTLVILTGCSWNRCADDEVLEDWIILKVCQKCTGVEDEKCSTGWESQDSFELKMKMANLHPQAFTNSVLRFDFVWFFFRQFGLFWSDLFWFRLIDLITTLKYPQGLLLAHRRVLSHLLTENIHSPFFLAWCLMLKILRYISTDLLELFPAEVAILVSVKHPKSCFHLGKDHDMRTLAKGELQILLCGFCP